MLKKSGKRKLLLSHSLPLTPPKRKKKKKSDKHFTALNILSFSIFLIREFLWQTQIKLRKMTKMKICLPLNSEKLKINDNAKMKTLCQRTLVSQQTLMPTIYEVNSSLETFFLQALFGLIGFLLLLLLFLIGIHIRVKQLLLSPLCLCLFSFIVTSWHGRVDAIGTI